jgi:hypothetical protein
MCWEIGFPLRSGAVSFQEEKYDKRNKTKRKYMTENEERGKIKGKLKSNGTLTSK